MTKQTGPVDVSQYYCTADGTRRNRMQLVGHSTYPGLVADAMSSPDPQECLDGSIQLEGKKDINF